MRYIPTFLFFYSFLFFFLCVSVRHVFSEAPTTSKIVFTSWRDGNAEIYTMNPDGSDAANLTRHVSQDQEPVWSPTGEHILFVSDRDGVRDLYLMDADGKNVKRVFEKMGRRRSPTWHPNGERIAYVDFGEWALYTVDRDGRDTKRLALTGEKGGYTTDWSPDGSEIAFVFVEDIFQTKIQMINPKTRARRTLRNPHAQGVMDDPAWSPWGDRIAYALILPAALEKGTIYIRDRKNGASKQVVPEDGSRAFAPAWSPHGNEILYEKVVNKNKQIFKVHISSGIRTRLTHTNASNGDANWFDPAALPVQPRTALLTTLWGKLKQK